MSFTKKEKERLQESLDSLNLKLGILLQHYEDEIGY